MNLESSNNLPAVSGTKPSRVRYGVLAALCIAAIIAYVQRNSIGVAEAEIRYALNLSKWEMGWVMSAFFLPYALLQLPAGYLGQTWGTRRALSFFAVVFSAAAGVFALALGMWSLVAARAAMGATQAGIFPCAINTIRKWMPDTQRAFSSGMLGSCMSIGGASGAALTGILIFGVAWNTFSFAGLDWRWVFALYAVPGLVFAVVFYLWFRDSPEQHPSVNAAERELIHGPDSNDAKQSSTTNDIAKEPTPWRWILTNPAILGLYGQQVCRAAGYMFFASWFATYLRETRQVDSWVIGVLTSLPLWAVVIGSPSGGLLSDWLLARTGNRRLARQGVAATAMFICFLMVLLSYPFDNPWWAVLLISAGSFFASFGGPCAYTSTIDMGGKHVPMVFSTMNMAGNLGAFCFPIIVPWLLSESELFVNKLEIAPTGKATATERIVIEVESQQQRNTTVVKKYGEQDDEVLRFHHGKKQRQTLFAEYKILADKAGTYQLRVHFAGQDPPPLRLIVNGKTISANIVTTKESQHSPEILRWSEPQQITLNPGDNTLRLECESSASGNWDAVLFMFAGIWLVACICWLFANTNVTIEQINHDS